MFLVDDVHSLKLRRKNSLNCKKIVAKECYKLVSMFTVFCENKKQDNVDLETVRNIIAG